MQQLRFDESGKRHESGRTGHAEQRRRQRKETKVKMQGAVEAVPTVLKGKNQTSRYRRSA